MREKGLIPISANFEPQIAGPYDGRGRVPTQSDLLQPQTWTAHDGNIYTYVGMPVVVYNDAANNGLYLLMSADFTLPASWERVANLPGQDGADGQEISIQKTTTHIQWRLGAGEWINLVALADLKGDKGEAGIDGQEISIQKTTTHIQWCLGNGTWVNLVALADLKGDKGDAGTPGIDGADGTPGADGQEISIQKTTTHIQWRLGTGEWINLVALADLKGDKGDTGNDGVDGQEVSIQKTTTHIQWRLGNGNWVNLIPLADLKGDSGDDARLTTLIPVIADTLGACLALFRHNTILSIGIFTKNPDLLNQVNEAGNDIEALIDILNAY
ncbi:MAG: hypothetical protein RBR42_13590 [Desulfomicrobium sp.]|nr:hypothetical protein [Desulfomicrobium sp.]